MEACGEHVGGNANMGSEFERRDAGSSSKMKSTGLHQLCSHTLSYPITCTVLFTSSVGSVGAMFKHNATRDPALSATRVRQFPVYIVWMIVFLRPAEGAEQNCAFSTCFMQQPSLRLVTIRR